MNQKILFIVASLFLSGCIHISSYAPPALPTTAATAVPPPPTPILPSATPLPPTGTAVLPPTATSLPTNTAVPTPTAAPELVRPHFTLDIALDTTARTAQVTQTVTLRNDSGDDWEELVFNISQAYWPGVFRLGAVAVTDSAGIQQAISYELHNTMLHLRLPQPLLPDEQVVIQFDFDLSLPRLDPLGWGPEGNSGWEPDLIQMGDFYPALVPYQSGSGWQTWEFIAVGDPVINGLADYDVTITLAADYVVAAAGSSGSDNAGHHFHLEKARSFAFLASSDYVRLDDVVAGIPVSVFVTRGYREMGLVVLQTAVNALALFNQQYGPYPYPELIIAENGFLTSNEYSGFISLGGYLFDTHNGGYDSLLVALTAHEIGHQWWYGGVGNDQVHEPWLDESLAMYSELIYYERYHPDLMDWWWQARVDRWNPTGPANATIYDYPDSATYVHNMYGRATYFIWDLRQTMGKEVFKTFLQAYFQQNRDQISTTEEFFALAMAINGSPIDLSPLQQQYFKKQ
ncbi:MAG: M1 family metallopeptidase [Ardenticatenaceae bacterium]|nr:M1 family metallopeptidase [Ardenticatenaceae bacterium]